MSEDEGHSDDDDDEDDDAGVLVSASDILCQVELPVITLPTLLGQNSCIVVALHCRVPFALTKGGQNSPPNDSTHCCNNVRLILDADALSALLN